MCAPSRRGLVASVVIAAAAALQRALTMPLEERRSRHAALKARVWARDVNHWRESFLGDLKAD